MAQSERTDCCSLEKLPGGIFTAYIHGPRGSPGNPRFDAWRFPETGQSGYPRNAGLLEPAAIQRRAESPHLREVVGRQAVSHNSTRPDESFLASVFWDRYR